MLVAALAALAGLAGAHKVTEGKRQVGGGIARYIWFLGCFFGCFWRLGVLEVLILGSFLGNWWSWWRVGCRG